MNNSYLSTTLGNSSTRGALALSLAVFSIAGCSADEAENVRTSGYFAEYRAVATGDGMMEVSARLKTGGERSQAFADLKSRDCLTAYADDTEKIMSRIDNGNGSPYLAQFDGDDGGTLIHVAFERGDIDDDALGSFAALPEPFSLRLGESDGSVMSEGDELARGNTVGVTWDGETDGTMFWEATGDCIWTRDGTIVDDGDFVLDAEYIEARPETEGETCEVTITLERINQGDLDPSLGGGQFEAIQRRFVRFMSTPSADEAAGLGGARN